LTDKFNKFNLINNPVIVLKNNEIIFQNIAAKQIYGNVTVINDITESVQEQSSKYRVHNTLYGERTFSVERYPDDEEESTFLEIHHDLSPSFQRKAAAAIENINEEGIKLFTDKALAQNSHRLTQLIDKMLSGIIIEDNENNVIHTNPEFFNIFNIIDKTPHAGLNIELFLNAINDLTLIEFFSRYREIKNGSSGFTQIEIPFKDGRHYRMTYYRLFERDETSGHIWGFDDISTNKETESRIAELLNLFNAIENSKNLGIFMTSKNYTFVNEGFSEITGISSDDFSTESLCNCITNLHESQKQSLISDIQHSSGSLKEIEFKRNDENIWVDIYYDNMDIQGVSYCIGTINDVTRTVTLADKLKKSEITFQEMFEKNRTVMMMLDPETLEIRMANSAAVEFYGTSLENLKKIPFDYLCTDSDIEKFRTLYKNLNSSEKNAIMVQQNCAGMVLDVEINFTPIPFDDTIFHFLVIQDVTARVKYEDKLRLLNRNLEKLVNEEASKRRRNEEILIEKSRLADMGEMVGNIAHQWRQPLNSLGLIVQDFQDAYEHDEIDSQYIANSVNQSMELIKHMSKTIDDFRNFFKPLDNMTVFDLNKEIEAVTALVAPRLINNGIKIHTDNLNEQICAYGFPNQLKQVIINIIGNAIDALSLKIVKDAEFTPLINIKIGYTNRTSFIMIENNGEHIPDLILDKIFKPYFTTKEDTGTGIGLYMAKLMIEDNMNGKIYAENTEKGVCFTIELMSEEK